MDYKLWNSISNWAAIGFAIGTAVSLVGIFITGNRIQEISEDKQAAAEKKQAVAEEKLTAAEEKQRIAESKITRLEKEAEGRRLVSSKIEILTEALRSVAKPSVPVYLMGLDGDKEAIDLANQLKIVFEAAGFKIDGVWQDGLLGGTGSGILIRQKVKDGVIGVGIEAALKTVGLDSKIVVRSDYEQDKIDVIVGYNPS
jgi:hypothetical protein